MGTEQSKIQPEILDDLHRNTQYSEEEIQSRYKEFLADYPSGYLRMEEFKKAYSDSVGHGDASKFAEYVFHSFDTNGDGVLDFREYLIGLHITSRGTIEQKIRLAFKMYDLDGNGYITCDEMLKVTKSLHKITSIVNLPHNISGARRRSAALFRKLDINSDGKIRYNEFQEVIRSDPCILALLNYYNPSLNTTV